MTIYDVLIIGGGQSALACGYYLRRSAHRFRILDAQERCGGAWRQGWDSLTLFSPAEYSSLPGWIMPESAHEFPTREEVIDYLCAYEQRYELPIERPVEVERATKSDNRFVLETSAGTYYSRALISATGTLRAPIIPKVEGRDSFKGVQIHSSEYRNPDAFRGKKVMVVGEGNSGAQILAELSRVTTTRWATRKEPEFLPADVDGRALFDRATAQYYAQREGKEFDPESFHKVVQVPPVAEALKRGVMQSSGSMSRLTETGVQWTDGSWEEVDAIVWCTGFGYATEHLSGLVETDEVGRTATNGTRSTQEPGLWLVGYGGWTGFASATLIGVGRSARRTVQEIDRFLAD